MQYSMAQVFLITQAVVDNFLSVWGAGCLTSYKPFNFGADPVHDRDPGICTPVPLDRDKFRNFPRWAALWFALL